MTKNADKYKKRKEDIYPFNDLTMYLQSVLLQRQNEDEPKMFLITVTLAWLITMKIKLIHIKKYRH